MAAPKIQLRRSSVSGKKPTTTQLQLGELAVNTYDGKVYIKQDTDGVGVGTTVVTVNPWEINEGETELSFSGSVSVGGSITAGTLHGDGNAITNFPLENLSDVTLTNVGQHDILTYHNGEGWLNDPGASRVVQEIRNTSGVAITEGYPVYQTGYNQGSERVEIAISDASDPTKMPALGIIHNADLGNNSNGFVIVSGIADGIDTSDFSEGDELWVAVGGGLTNSRPTNPNDLVQKIGVVLRSSAGTGSILVQGAGRTNDVPNKISIGNSITAGSFYGGTYYGDGSGLTGVVADTDNDWVRDSAGIHTTAKVGVGTETANSAYDLHVVGSGQTALFVQGGARVSGMLSVGENTITLDGQNNIIYVGDEVLISGDSINIGGDISIGSTASGINTCPNVLYVAKDGLDISNGTSIDTAKGTIGGALAVAKPGTTIFVKSGTYIESNPLTVPTGVSIVGDSLREVTVTPQTATSDLFYVNKGTLLQGMTFSGHTAPAAAVAFPPTKAINVGGTQWESPYVRNCTSNTTTGTGMRIDGKLADGLKSMVVDSYTQYNQGGVGIALTNQGYAQLVSAFTVCCDKAITAHKGGQCSLTNSNCDFGNFGLVADGVSDLQFQGETTALAAAGSDTVSIDVSTNTLNISGFVYDNLSGLATVTTSADHGFLVGMGVTLSDIVLSCDAGTKTYPDRVSVYDVREVPSSTSFIINAGISTLTHTYSSGGTAAIDVDRPYEGQIVYFGDLYNTVQEITVTNGGSGYTSTPDVTISAPTGPNGRTSTARATVVDGVVTEITVISSGSQYEATPTVTIGAPDSGVTAAASAVLLPTYYTINSSTPISSGITTVTLDENLLNSVGSTTEVNFYQQSKIVASSHTFEYVGTGVDITTATPKRGGVPIPENEVVMTNGGKVVYTSTDQAGNFRIGEDFTINQNTGTISGRAFSQSLFAQMTPFILALSD